MLKGKPMLALFPNLAIGGSKNIRKISEDTKSSQKFIENEFYRQVLTCGSG